MKGYPAVIEPLSEENGGGYVCRFPDLPGCFSDGETPDEALSNGLDALSGWLEVQAERGVLIPAPYSSQEQVKAKMNSLLEAMKNLLDFAEYADARIPQLEAQLDEIISKLSNDWKSNDALLAHAALAGKALIAKH